MPPENQNDTGLPGPDELFFAYGTLKQGGQYHHLLESIDAELLGTGHLSVPYPLILAAYPCLLDQPESGHPVIGEIYRIPLPEHWNILDRLEGHPQEYRRRPETVQLEGTQIHAWTYFYLQPDQLDPALESVSEFKTR